MLVNLIEVFILIMAAISIGITIWLRREEAPFYKPKPKPVSPPPNESPEDKEKREKQEKEEKRRKAEEERKRKQKQDEDFEKIYKPYLWVATTVLALVVVTWTIVKKITS